jgi:hypothetical protein
MRNLQPLTSKNNGLCTNLWTNLENLLVRDYLAVDDRGCGNVNNRDGAQFCPVAGLRRLRRAFQVSGRSGSDAQEWSMITYREVVIVGISVRGCQDR